MEDRYIIFARRIVFTVIALMPSEWIDEAIARLIQRAEKEKNKG